MKQVSFAAALNTQASKREDCSRVATCQEAFVLYNYCDIEIQTSSTPGAELQMALELQIR